MKKQSLFLFLVCLTCTGLVGCMSMRTIYIPNGQAVKLRQTVKKVKVWILDKEKKMVEGTMDLPEGWYCLPKE